MPTDDELRRLREQNVELRQRVLAYGELADALEAALEAEQRQRRALCEELSALHQALTWKRAVVAREGAS